MAQDSTNDAPPPPPRDFLARRVREVCNACGSFIEYWGFKAIYGRAWALLAISTRPLTQSEVAETLGVSRSLMSSTMAELSRLGLVRTTHDHRNAPYEAIMDVWPVIADVLRNREWMLVESVRMALEAAIEEAEFLQSRGRPFDYDLRSLKLLLSMTEMAQSLLRILIRMRVPPSEDGITGWIALATRVVRQLSAR